MDDETAGPIGDNSPVGPEGWAQLQLMYEWLRGPAGNRVTSSWLDKRRLPVDLVDEILGESFSYLLDWVRRSGPFAEESFEPGRLATFAITRRGGPNVVRRRARIPLARPASSDAETDYVEKLPDVAPAIGQSPELALLALAQEHAKGRLDAETYAAAQYFLSRHFDLLGRPSWIPSDPGGGTNEIDKLVWETYQYVRGRVIEPPISAKVRDDKRKLWIQVRRALAKILE